MLQQLTEIIRIKIAEKVQMKMFNRIKNKPQMINMKMPIMSKSNILTNNNSNNNNKLLS